MSKSTGNASAINENDIVPEGLAPTQYAAWICENVLAWPANQSNLLLLADCITAIAKKYRRTPDKAMKFLHLRILEHQQTGAEIDGFYFREGKYMIKAPKPDRALPQWKSPVDPETYSAMQAERKGFFASEEYKQFLQKMKAKGL